MALSTQPPASILSHSIKVSLGQKFHQFRQVLINENYPCALTFHCVQITVE